MKTLFSNLILCLTALSLSAQPTIEWQKSLGGAGHDEAYSIKQTSDGGYITAGYNSSTDGDVTGNHGGQDYWVVKLTGSGAITWQKSLGGTANDRAYNIQQTTDGGYIVAGYSNSTGGDVTGNHGGADIWIVKLSSTGTLEWQKSLGGTGDDWGASVQQTSDGGFIIAGTSESNNGDVSGNHGNADYWIVKLSGSGIVSWQKSLGGTGSDEASAIQQTPDGGYIVAGQSYSNNGDVNGNHGGGDFWIVKLDNTGAIDWQKALGGTDPENANSIQQTGDGGYIVGGYSYSKNGDVTGNHGVQDCWVVKLDSAGNIDWQKSLGGMADESVNSIQQPSDGGYLVAGFTRSNDGDVIGHIGSYDYWLLKLSNTGDIIWQKSLGGTNVDFAFAILQTAEGGYMVAGISNSTDGDVTGNHGGDDFWIVKLSTTVGVDEIAQQCLFSVFPNPANDQINIKTVASLIGTSYTIHDIKGQPILSGKINLDPCLIGIENLPIGTYVVQIQSKEGLVTSRFIKE